MKLTTLFILLFIISSIYSLKPDKKYLITPDSLGLNSITIEIKSTDNIKLKSWILKPMGELNLKTSIIVSYGDSGNMSYWLNHAAILSQLGYTVILFDYRGFGQSSDFEMNLNQLYYDEFSEDLKAVFDWTKKNINNKNIGIWGLSMGTIMSGLLIENNQPDFLILEGLVDNPTKIKQNIFKNKGKTILLTKSSTKLPEIYKNSKVPMLIFSASEDKTTTSQDSKKVSEYSTNRKFIEYNGNHLQGFNSMTENYFGDNYIKEIEKFITKKDGW